MAGKFADLGNIMMEIKEEEKVISQKLKASNAANDTLKAKENDAERVFKKIIESALKSNIKDERNIPNDLDKLLRYLKDEYFTFDIIYNDIKYFGSQSFVKRFIKKTLKWKNQEVNDFASDISTLIDRYRSDPTLYSKVRNYYRFAKILENKNAVVKWPKYMFKAVWDKHDDIDIELLLDQCLKRVLLHPTLWQSRKHNKDNDTEIYLEDLYMDFSNTIEKINLEMV